MRHLKKGRKLKRKTGGRQALLMGLLGNLLRREEIVTTEAKARELGPIAERVINQSKDMLAAEKTKSIRALRKVRLSTYATVEKEKLKELAKRFSARSGGYTRIIKMGHRRSDSARMALIRILKD